MYINEKIVLDIFAVMEDGFSTASQVSYTEHKQHENLQGLEAGLSTTDSI